MLAAHRHWYLMIGVTSDAAVKKITAVVTMINVWPNDSFMFLSECYGKRIRRDSTACFLFSKVGGFQNIKF